MYQVLRRKGQDVTLELSRRGFASVPHELCCNCRCTVDATSSLTIATLPRFQKAPGSTRHLYSHQFLVYFDGSSHSRTGSQ